MGCFLEILADFVVFWTCTARGSFLLFCVYVNISYLEQIFIFLCHKDR